MKKIAILLVIVMICYSLFSCDVLLGLGGTNGNNDNNGSSDAGNNVTPPVGDESDKGDNDQPGNTDGEQPDNGDNEQPDNGESGDNEGSEEQNPNDEINTKIISVNTINGLNEQIHLNISANENYDYTVYYKNDEDAEYSELDKNLMIASEGKLDCYILGIKKGKYTVKIKAEGVSTEDEATLICTEIDVAAQDRSGYAHFGYSDGVGAYNDDGTVKEGTKIVYVTNENKNTVTLEIDGTEYVGLVNILQAQYKSNTPMLIRVIGKISTNQWNYKNVEPRLSDGSNVTDDFFDNTFSNQYGENLANLIVKLKGNGLNAKTYNYKTTPEGLTEVRLTNGGTKYATYKGSDFPSLVGKSVFDDDSYYNMLEVKGSKNITIEGVGSDAEFFQFGVSFEESSSIEIKNITFTDYPEDALNFLGGDRADLANYGRYWVHNCTFNRGYNAWDISGERDKYAGDGSIDFNNVSSLTLSYNYFNSCKKTMLFGSGDSEACMNFTIHHNYFYKVDSRLPLGRNVNIHSYNNFFDQCRNSSDLRSKSYLFSESNYYNSTTSPFILNNSSVKSYSDIFINSSSGAATIVTDRAKLVSIACKPDKTTNYSGFDTSTTLFYYNAAEKKTDVMIMHDASYLPSYIPTVAGAGHLVVIEVN